MHWANVSVPPNALARMSSCRSSRVARRCSPDLPTRRCHVMTVTASWSSAAHDTYLRTYRGVLDANRVVEFILLDRLFQRWIFSSLKLAEHSLDELLHNRG